MKKDNNIDRIFSEGLANYSEKPPAFVWDAIAGGMQGAKQNKKALILWRGLAAAAVIGLLFMGGLFWNNINKSNSVADANLQQPGSVQEFSDTDNTGGSKNKTVIDKDLSGHPETQSNISKSENNKLDRSVKLPAVKSATPNTDTDYLASVGNTNTDYDSTNKSTDNKLDSSTQTGKGSVISEQAINSTKSENYAQFKILEFIDAKGKAIENNPLLQKMDAQTDTKLAQHTSPDAMRLLKIKNKAKNKATLKLNTAKSNTTDNWLLAFNKDESAKKTDKKGLQFALGGQFSPSYSYRETGSSEGSNMAANNEDGIMSYTGGINLNIKTRKRWEIETGVYYSQVGQKFSNPLIGHPDKMIFAAGSNAGIESKKPNLQNSMGNITLETSAQQELIQEVAISNAAFRLNSDNLAYSSAQVEAITVQQELDYIEIPFLLRYNLLNKSVGLSVSGGMSTNFLIGNNAYRIENSSKNRIGETQDINEISYSAIFGLGLRAPILKSLDFNLEPRVRYFMNSITDSPGSSYKPYSIGIYTGVSYRF